MNIKTKNEIKFYTADTLYNTALIIASSSVLQTFMLETGIKENYVAQFISIFQIVQGAAMILCAELADRVKNVVKVTAIFMLNLLFLLIPMIVLSVAPNYRGNAYIIMLIVGCISNILLGFYNVVVYKLPYHIMDMNRYGKVTANCGILYGITGIIVTAIMTYFISKCEYFGIMKIILLAAIVMNILSFIIATKYKKINDAVMSNEEKGENINIFKYKPFLNLFIPNLTRGIGTGFIGVAVTVGYFFNVIDKVSGGYIVIITNGAVILSCLLMSAVSKRGRNGIITLISSVIILLFMSLMLIGKSTIIFLLGYAVAYFAVNVVSIGVPVLVTEIIDYKVMGQYTAWRMMLFTMGSALGGFLAIPMCEKIGGIFTMVIAGVMFLITGIGYFLYEKKSK